MRKILLLLALAAMAASCKKDGPDPDIELPALTLTGVTANDTLRNTVSLEIKAEDAGGISKVDVFANDSLISTSPLGDLKVSWNTLKSKDGNYVLKVVGTDVSGNKKEASFNVIVSNALIRLEKDVFKMIPYQSEKYLITDADGKIIATKTFEKGAQLNAPVSIYPSEAFSGKEVHVLHLVKTDLNKLECFLNVKRGVSIKGTNLPGYQFKNNNFIKGPATFAFTNLPSYDAITVSSDRSGGAFPSVTPGHMMQLTGTPSSKILVQIEKDGKAKHHFYEFGSTNPLILDAALCTTPSLTKNIKFQGTLTNASIYMYGLIEPNFSENYSFTDKHFSGNNVNVFYPDSLVKTFGTSITYEKQGRNFHHFYNGIPENVQFMDANGVITSPGISNFQVSFTGTFNYYKLYYDNTVHYTDPGYLDLTIIGSPNLTTFKFPDVFNDLGIPGLTADAFKLRSFRLYGSDKVYDKLEIFNFYNGSANPSGSNVNIIESIPVVQ